MSLLGKRPAASEAQLVTIAEGAAARRADGLTLYIVPLLLVQIGAWSDICEAIESEGWRLEHFAIAPEGHAVAVFRRT